MRLAGIVVAVVALLVIGCDAVQPSGSARSDSPAPSAVAIATPNQAAVVTPTPTPRAAATPSPSRPAPPEPTPILDGSIALIDGWTSLARMAADGGDAEGGGVVSGGMPAGWSSVLVSVACAGTGTLHVVSGDDMRDVDCPMTTGDPERIVSFANTPAYQVEVTRDGQVAYEVRVDGAKSVLMRPSILIAGTGKAARMTEGCGLSLDLSWGYNASDGCATTLPGDPIPTVAARNGRVDIRIPGWTIVDGIVRCGRIGPNDVPEFIELRGCHPASKVDGSRATITGLPTTGGRRLLEFRFTAENAAGDSFHVPYYAYVRP